MRREYLTASQATAEWYQPDAVDLVFTIPGRTKRLSITLTRELWRKVQYAAKATRHLT